MVWGVWVQLGGRVWFGEEEIREEKRRRDERGSGSYCATWTPHQHLNCYFNVV